MKRLFPLLSLLLCSHATAASPTITVALGGDVMFGRVTPDGWRPHPATELAKWRDALRDADVAIVNLETGICAQGRQRSRLPLFWAPAERLDLLVDAGVDVANIANNHALDCGAGGIDQTANALDDAGIAAAGIAERGALLVRDDVVVVGATMHPPPYRSVGQHVIAFSDPTVLTHLVRRTRDAHRDKLLIVSIHWGKERSPEPATRQRELARALVDAGADAIAGHGPHTPQPEEIYRGALIAFSLGNLVFDDRSPLGRPRAPRVVTFRRTSAGWRTL